MLGEREVVFRVGTTEVTTRLIEGEFPNYQQLIPSGYPNRLTVSRDALQAAVNRVRLVGQSSDTAPIRLAMSAEGLELSAIAQDVGEAHESVEAKYEGTDVTVAFNSQFLLDGIDAAASDEVVIESIDPLKPAVLQRHRHARLPLPADARAHLLTRRSRLPCTSPGSGSPTSAATRRPTLALPTRRHGDLRGQRAGQDQPARGRRAGPRRASRSGASPTPRWCATAASAAILRAEVVDGERVQLLEAEIRAQGRNRVQLNRQTVAADARPARAHAGDGVRARRPPAGEGRARRRGATTSTTSSSRSRRGTRRRAPTTSGCSSNATRCCGAGCGATTPRPPSTCSTCSWRAAGAELARGRLRLLERLVPAVAERRTPSSPARARTDNGASTTVDAAYECAWSDTALRPRRRHRLRAAHRARVAPRRAEIDRGVTLAGPHRDEWRLRLGGLESRTHASQGEQRTLALALRLGGHRLCTRDHRHRAGAAARRRVQRARRAARPSRSRRISTPGRRWSRPRAGCLEVCTQIASSTSKPVASRPPRDAMTRPATVERSRPGPDR